VVDFLFVMIKLLFAIAYGLHVISGKLSKSACFEGGRSLWAQISDGRGASPANHCWSRETKV